MVSYVSILRCFLIMIGSETLKLVLMYFMRNRYSMEFCGFWFCLLLIMSLRAQLLTMFWTLALLEMVQVMIPRFIRRFIFFITEGTFLQVEISTSEWYTLDLVICFNKVWFFFLQNFLQVWDSVCQDSSSPTLLVPQGYAFLLQQIQFNGPCQSEIHVQVIVID